MKPFSLNHALSGKPVVTRSGLSVTQLTLFKVDLTEYPVFAVINGSIYSFGLKGDYASLVGESHLDLFMASEKQQGWINIYPKETSRKPFVGYVYPTEFEAKAASCGMCETIHIEWEG